MKLSKHELFVHGSALRRIINDDAFLVAVEHLKEEYKSCFFNSGPTDQSAREKAYQMNFVLDDLITTMITLAQRSEADALFPAVEDDETEE